MEDNGNNKIFKSIKNLIYNLEKANYKYEGNENTLYSNINNYSGDTPDILNFVATHKETNIKCYVTYRTIKHINKKNLYENTINLYETLLKENDFIVLVVDDDSLDTIKSYLKYESKLPYYIHIFNLYSLQFKILEHKFVPKHSVLNDNEKKEFYEKYNIKSDSQIPEISRFDPVANAIFLKPGQVCKILRYDKSSFVNEYYRICI